MKTKQIILIALFLFSALAVAGCGVFHHCGPRHCKPGCETAAGQPCPQPGTKPCCEKMQGVETPAK